VCADIISLRNLAEAVRNPFLESNKTYSGLLKTESNNRPFSSIKKTADSFVVSLILLPHQIVVFPNELLTKIAWIADPSMIIYGKDEIR
jgi:hypothetical protein